MKFRDFGRLGWSVAEIGFGGWAIGGSWGPQSDKDSRAALEQALRAHTWQRSFWFAGK